MKEIIKTIAKKYDAEGKLIEHTEVIVEKEVQNNIFYDPNKCFPQPPWKPSCGSGQADWLYWPTVTH